MPSGLGKVQEARGMCRTQGESDPATERFQPLMPMSGSYTSCAESAGS
jgi:hypothetical protein